MLSDSDYTYGDFESVRIIYLGFEGVGRGGEEGSVQDWGK